MRTTEVRRHAAARKVILRGIKEVYDTVRLTLGPEGGNALILRSFNRGSRITNDGVTIAKCIRPKDEFEALVAEAFKEGAAKTGERAGDGTTSTTVIAGKLIIEAFKLLPATSDKEDVEFNGVSSNRRVGVVSLKKKILASISPIQEAVKKVTKKIKKVDELENIADVSLNGNREVAKIVADMVWRTGENGFISLTDGFKGTLETQVIEGARFPMKVPHVNFLTNPERYEMVAEEADCVVTNIKMDNLRDFSYLWNNINPDPRKPHAKLVIFSPDFSEEVLGQMLNIMFPMNENGKRMPSGMRIFPCKCPSLRTEQFDDLAVFLDARFIDYNKGDKFSSVKEFDLGFVDKCTLKGSEDREDAILLGGKGAKITKVAERIEMLKKQKEATNDQVNKVVLDKRIASLASAGGLIRVGAATEAEGLPLKHKIEDAVFACQNAIKHGYVEGGGLCLKKIADELFADDALIHDALCAPYFQIQVNAGGEVEIGKDIIDPSRVVELEVEHGFQVAANLITCKAVIPEFDEHDPRDGYRIVANAINLYNKLWGTQQNLFKSGLNEAEAEQLARTEALIRREGED